MRKIIFLIIFGLLINQCVNGQTTSNDFNANTAMTTAGNYSAGAPSNTHAVRITTSGGSGLTISSANVVMGSLSVTNGSTYTITNATSTANTRTLTLGNSTAFTNPYSTVSNDIIFLSGNSTLNLLGTNTGGGTGIDNFVLVSSGNFNVSTGSSLTIGATGGGDLQGAFNINKTGGGTFFLTPTKTYTGKTTITGGFINTTGESAFGTNPGSFVADQITLNGGGIQASTGNITFSSNRGITLGSSGGTFDVSSTRTITALNVIRGTGGLTKTGAGTLTATGVHTYTGTTTINGGTLSLSGSGSIANSPTIIVGSGATFDVTAVTTALTLGASQTLSASATGSNTTGTITVASSKNLTLSNGGLTYTALASTTTPPLTVAGTGGSIVLVSGGAITVPNNLAVGTYKLIAKSGSATVTGTTGTLNYTGTGNGTTASVAITSGELILTVTNSTFTVTFDGNGSTSGSMSNQTASVATNLTANAFARTGYSFAGWNTLANGTGTAYANSASYPFTANTTLYAQWTANNNIITFDGNGSTGGSTATQTIATAATASLTANGYTRTGYTFAGWNTLANGTGTAYANTASYTMGTANVTLYAQWTINSYTVTFDGNSPSSGSPSIASVSGNYNTNVTLATAGTLVKTGFTFGGWNTAADGSGTTYASGLTTYTITSNITLYAVWTVAGSFTVVFDANGGSGSMANQTTNVPTALTSNTFTRTGYTFAGWNTIAGGGGTSYADGSSYAFTANVTLYAQWTPNTNTLTFDGNGFTGGSTASQTIATAATATLNANGYTRTGYTFANWNTASNGSGISYANSASYTMGTANTTLYAQWTPNNNTITFDGNGSTGGSTASQVIATAATASLIANGYTRTGYSFANWNTAADGSGTSYANSASYTMGTANVTLFAQWSINSYTVTFNGNSPTSGTPSIASVTGVYNTNVTLASIGTLVKTGYTFAGWNTASNGSGTSYAAGLTTYTVLADITLFAQWTPNNNTITFDGNGFTGGSTATQTIATAATATLNANGYTRTGYSFAGWATTAGGAVAFANSASYTMGTANVTLFAKWTPNNNTITFNGNGFTGGSTATQTIATAATATLTANGFTRTGYLFTGWNTAADGSGTSYANSASYTMGTTNVTLYAQWGVAPCLSEDFTSTTFPPTGWIQTTTTRSTTAADYISAPGAALFGSNNGTLTTFMLTNPSSLSFYLGRSSNTTAKTMNIKVSTTSQTTGFTTIATYDHSNVPVSSYNQYTVSLAAYSSISTVWIQFEKVSSTTSPWRLDDISVSCAPACTPPVTAPTLFDTISVTSNTATITWTRGSGDSVLVVARAGSAVNTDPSSGFSYNANATFGSGSQLGTANYVVYKGTGTSATISGLNSNTTYHFAIYEYGSVSTCYNTTELTGNTTTKNPTVTLSSTNPAINASNVSAGTTNNVIYRFTLNSVGSATLTGVTINTSGTYVASNITNFKCWYSADTIFTAGTDILLATKNTSLAAGSQVFPSFTNQAIAHATNAYIFITCDLPCTATALNNISVVGLSTADFSIAAGSKTGSSFAGGTQTIQSAIPNNVTSHTTTSCSNGATTVSWTTPVGCFSNILVFAKAGSFSSTIPTGTGVSYTADTVYGNGTAFDGGFCVFKGTLSSFIMSGLSNGTNYTYKIFTRNDLNWSSGITTNCTPVADIADNGCSTNNYTDLIVNYPTSSTITDLNVGIKISHTYRGDLRISLISPDSTEILLVNQVGGSATNFDAIIDDAGTANAFTSGNHTVDGTYDVTGQPQGVGVGTLASLIGKNAQGNWKIRVCDNASGDVGSIVSAELFVTGCNSTAVVNSFIPTSGSAGTLITIKGSGFTGTSAVKFNNINSPSVMVISDTQLTAEVPANASSGKIAVYNASACPSLSGATFNYLNQSGTCGGGFTGLIISEIYDANANNVFNIELYNPTSSTITLTGVYSIGIKADNIGGYARTINLTGSIAAGGIYTAALGTSSQTCSYSYDFTLGGSGVNELDGVYLLNSGSVQDLVVCPNEVGYTITRNTTATGPSASFSSGDWTFNSTETCAGIGSFTPSPSFTITNQPIDVSICSFKMGVVASGTGLTYQWKFNDPATMNGWLNVTTTNLQATNSRNSGVSVSGATSDTIRLTGDLTYLYNYQFYCEVIKTSCTASSNAAQFNYDAKPVYRSVALASGNWSNPANWEMALTTAGPWNSACTYPIALNSSEVIIQNGTTITLDFDNSIDKVTIENTGELILLSSTKLTLLNSNTGADLIVNGKLTDRGATGNGINFEDNSGTSNDASWILGTNGTIVKTNTSSVVKYRDFYQGGIATIPATANWYYRNNGDGAPITNAVGMYYPNLHFENAIAGNYSWSSSLLSLVGASDYCRVKGNLNIGMSGIGTCTVINNNINTNPMFIVGNLQIGLGSIFTNASYDTIVDTSHGNGSGIEVQGNIICNGSLLFNFGTGLIKLTGTSLQTLSSTTGGTFETYNLQLNNTNNALLSGLTTNIFNNLIFTNGKIRTNVLTTDAVFVRNTNTTAIIGGLTSGASKYVEGKLKWTTSGTGTYTFPIGHSTQNAQGFNINLTGASGSVIQAYLENNSTTPTQVAAYCDLERNPTGLGVVQVGSGLTGTDGILDSIGFNLASPLQWDITNPGGGITSYDLTVLANGGQDIAPITSVNGTAIRYLMKNGQPGNPGVATGTAGPSFFGTGFLACPTGYNLSGLTSFSTFTLNGSSPMSTALPVILTSFQVQAINESSHLSWTTSSEINNDKFIVERSSDAHTFIAIGTVKGNGNSTQTNHYSFIDTNPLKGTNYYRLKQIDFDQKFDYSSIEAVSFNASNSGSIHVYPNPSTTNFQLDLSAVQEDLQIHIIDMYGHTVLTQKFVFDTETKSMVLNTEKLPSGQYILQLIGTSTNQQLKINKQ
ncbi:MAG: InlB B-repeat-containing protein [Bacteroidota bacterium]